MLENDRAKLETSIEKEVHKLVDRLAEHMYDHTMIYLNRTQSAVDRATVDYILQIAKTAVKDGFLTHVDFFKKDIDNCLNEFTETSPNPLPPGEPGKKLRK